MLLSPVTKIWAAAVSDPPGSTDGGKITNAVSTAAAVGRGDPSGGASTSEGAKIKGSLMIAIHRATAVTTPVFVGLGGSTEDMTKSQSIVSPRPLSNTE